MRAIVFDRPGGPEVLQVATLPDPVPGPSAILVDVHAAGVNRADLLQRMGRYPPPPGASEILGLELAGEVVECGPGNREPAGRASRNPSTWRTSDRGRHGSGLSEDDRAIGALVH